MTNKIKKALDKSIIEFLEKATVGTVIEAVSILPALSSENVTLTVAESFQKEPNVTRMTFRLHWHGIFLAQKVATITDSTKLEWANAG